nr:GATA zinc finger domain-containing protein 14-like [Maniola hyperantus]
MRRTYRSKKETGGGLDPRDAVLAMDEKASAFDAFYIQNIKQTKRDLSVGASMFAASNKVRKRKYVKRLKDQEPIIRGTRESMSKSGCLTPDKSIHLKRAFDPFDLVLNSSSTKEVSSKPVNNVLSPLHTRGKGKRDKKEAPRKKKINYLSSDKTDSDKENSIDSSKNDKMQNLSDVLSHKLEIEKEEKIISNNIDESIINIVTDLSLLHKLQNLNSMSPLSSTMKDKLSFSPGQKSPICSTPFHKKYRGKSIYLFSPISAYVDDSKHYTITENPEESKHNENEVNSVPNATVQFASPDKKSVDYDKINSPIFPCRNVTDKNRTKESIKNYHPITKELSLLQTSEQEPFLGFSMNNASGAHQNINLEAVLEIKEKSLEDLKQSQYFTITNGENRNGIVDNKNNQYSSQEYDNDASSNPDTTLENQSVVAKSLEKLHSPKLIGKNIYGAKISFNIDKSGIEINLADLNNETGQGCVNAETPNQTHSEENSVDQEHSLNEENTLESSQFNSVKGSIIVNKEDSLKEENTSEPGQTYSEKYSIDPNEHSLNDENNLEPRQTYSDKYSIDTSEHSLNDENNLEPRQTYSEKYNIDSSKLSLNDENNLEPRQTYSEKYSIDTSEHSLNDENNLEPRQTYLEKYSIDISEHSLNDENNLEPRQTYSEKCSIDTSKHSLNDENDLEPRQTYSEKYSIDTSEHSLNSEDTLEPRQTYSEENSITEIEHNISVEESTSEEEIEQTISEPYQTHSGENNTAESEHSFNEEGISNNSIATDSLYESCYSENEKSDIEADNKELLVVIEGLNDSVKYDKEATLSVSSQSDESNDKSCSSDDSSNRYTSLDERYTFSKSTKSASDEDVKNELQEDTLMNISNNDQDVECDDENNKHDDDVFIKPIMNVLIKDIMIHQEIVLYLGLGKVLEPIKKMLIQNLGLRKT